MKVWALWEGGHGNYAPSDPERDLEVFDNEGAGLAGGQAWRCLLLELGGPKSIGHTALRLSGRYDPYGP